MTTCLIVTTFRKGLGIDDNFYNLLNEMENLKGEGITSRLVAGQFEGESEYSLLIEEVNTITISEIEKLAEKYHQTCYLLVKDNIAVLVNTIDDNGEMTFMEWSEVTRHEAIMNGDYTWDIDEKKFYIAT